MLSPAVEDYLKAAYKHQPEGEALLPTSELARVLEVSNASATGMAKRLAGLGLASYTAYQGLRLTEAGETVALEIIRHHRLLETYLKEVLGYSWKALHDEAEHLEHHISEEFEDKIEALLGYPTHDPHGDPIPARDGTMPAPATDALADAPEGALLVVERVTSSDADRLDRLEALGLLPGAQVRVERSEAEALVVRMERRDMAVPRALAEHVFVTAPL